MPAPRLWTGVEDGLASPIHVGAVRGHHPRRSGAHDRDKGADNPGRTDYDRAYRPPFDASGNEARRSVILFTRDDTVGFGTSRRMDRGVHARLVPEGRTTGPDVKYSAVDLARRLVLPAGRIGDVVPAPVPAAS